MVFSYYQVLKFQLREKKETCKKFFCSKKVDLDEYHDFNSIEVFCEDGTFFSLIFTRSSKARNNWEDSFCMLDFAPGHNERF